MRALLVVNPVASSVHSRNRARVEATLATAAALTVAETDHRGHAMTLARDAARDGFDAVVVLAGDGTLNEVAHGLAGTTTALAAVPGGSTNVFARTLGFAGDPRRVAGQVAASLAAGRTRRIGIGAACAPGNETRRFLFHLGVGFDAAIIARMERHAELKRHLAHSAFAALTVDTWLRRFDRGLRIQVSGDDDTASGPYAVISNSDPYAFVGPRRLSIAAQASLDRALAATVFSTIRLPVLVPGAWSAVTNGRYVASSPHITQWADIGRVTLTCPEPFPWQVDGDYLGSVERLDVAYEPDALTLVVP